MALSAIRGIALAGEIANDVRGAGAPVEGRPHAGMQTVASGTVGGEISGRAFAETASSCRLYRTMLRKNV